jgi:hypothetical protein
MSREWLNSFFQATPSSPIGAMQTHAVRAVRVGGGFVCDAAARPQACATRTSAARPSATGSATCRPRTRATRPSSTALCDAACKSVRKPLCGMHIKPPLMPVCAASEAVSPTAALASTLRQAGESGLEERCVLACPTSQGGSRAARQAGRVLRPGRHTRLLGGRGARLLRAMRRPTCRPRAPADRDERHPSAFRPEGCRACGLAGACVHACVRAHGRA